MLNVFGSLSSPAQSRSRIHFTNQRPRLFFRTPLVSDLPLLNKIPARAEALAYGIKGPLQ
jgi:hypothetical protein